MDKKMTDTPVAPSWQANLARIRQELAPGFQAVLDLAIRKIEAQLSDSAPKLGTNVPEMGTAAPSGCLSVAPEVLDKARLEVKSQLCGCCDEYSNDHAKDMANELLRLHALLSANTKRNDLVKRLLESAKIVKTISKDSADDMIQAADALSREREGK